MLQAFGLSFTPDPRVGPLFEYIDVSLNRGDKTALVGRNGAGKSVLMSMLAGRLAPSAGRIALAHGARVGYLPQDFGAGFDGSLENLLNREDANMPPHQVARSMHRLGLSPTLLGQSYETLSLGEKMRGALAALLASEPDLLLLDEPTNHLDLPTRLWLESFLRECPEGVLIACHDRAVINAVARHVLELDRGVLTEYTGGFDEMVSAKRLRFEQERGAWVRHKQEDRRLRIAAEEAYQKASQVTLKPRRRTYDPKQDSFYAHKQAKMDQRAKAILSRVTRAREDAPDKPFVADDVKLVFPSDPMRSHDVLVVRGLSKSYGRRVLFEGLNLTAERGSRIGVVGPNGYGKTTLFRILAGEEAADGGEVIWSNGTRVAVLSQGRDALDETLPAVRALGALDSDALQFARTALARLGLRGELVERPVGVLSVGERTKVEIVRMMLTGANVLFLDEPTNHLDLASIEALEGALTEFPGAILFTSHDRTFVDRLATEVIALG